MQRLPDHHFQGESYTMPLSIAQWHRRYQQQAQWTKNIRNHIYRQISINMAGNILDVGCGTGVLEDELFSLTSSKIYGLDIDYPSLKYARENSACAKFITGNSLQLPFPSGVFDITLCHFLLLWISDGIQAVNEMARVTRPRGFVLALAEPDYGGRIDYPPTLTELGEWQTQALINQGANPMMGRKLRSFFSKAGLVNVEVGILGGQWKETNSDQEFELEWQVIRSDLAGNSDFIEKAEDLKNIEILARQNQQRILFVPTFYAYGKVM
jgi:ubiquinone/menaquinone biosynthesis C-methylase UbiE